MATPTSVTVGQQSRGVYWYGVRYAMNIFSNQWSWHADITTRQALALFTFCTFARRERFRFIALSIRVTVVCEIYMAQTLELVLACECRPEMAMPGVSIA